MTPLPPAHRLKLAVLAAPACPVAAQLLLSGLFACRIWTLPVEPATSPPPWSERLYRALDKRLFGNRAAVGQDVLATPYDGEAILVSCPAHIVCLVDPAQVPELSAQGPVVVFQADGLPARRLGEAVRGQVGRPGGMVRLLWQVWAPGARPLGFEAACATDHRSVHRSIDQLLFKCRTTLLGLLRRLSEGVALPAVQPLLPGVPRAATRQLLSLLRDGLVWLLQRDQCWIRVYTAVGGMPTAAGGLTRPRPVPVLREAWHLSYPFLIEWQGELSMVPESSTRRTIDLYVCEQLPDWWRKVKTLVAGPRLADATLYFHQQRWWMFATHGLAGASMNDELHIYWADDLRGPWQAHVLNPVRIDARNTRPTGALFMLDGRLIRPVQDCSSRYGGALRFNEVVVLDPQAFEERDAGLPSLTLPGLASGVPVHTFNQFGGRLCVDSLHAVGRQLSLRPSKPDALGSTSVH